MTFDQADFEIRCEWGLRGLRALAPVSDVVIIVDVLSFSTALDVATSRGAADLSLTRCSSDTVRRREARGAFRYRPRRCNRSKPGTRLVLPSPNGAALAFSANHPIVLAACLRNATRRRGARRPLGHDRRGDSGRRNLGHGRPSAVRRRPGRRRRTSSRPFAAGSLLKRNSRRPRSHSSANIFRQCCAIAVPGGNCIERGYAMDVEIAAQLDVSRNVPRMTDRAFTGVRV